MDLLKIISESSLSFQEVAKAMFPMNEFQEKALRRLVNNPQSMSVQQIQTLCGILQKDPSDFMSQGFKAVFSEDTHTFKKGNNTIILNTKTWVSTLLNESGQQELVIGSPNMTLSEYFQSLNNIISQP